MKRTATLLALAPTAGFAHGTHMPVPEAAHGAAHAVPVLAALLILAALGLALFQRWKS